MGISPVWVTGTEQGVKLKNYRQTGRKNRERPLKRLPDV
jgi:hypothetical protein